MKLGDYKDTGPKPTQWPSCGQTLMLPHAPASHSSHVLTVDPSLGYICSQSFVPNAWVTGRSLGIKTIVGIKGRQPVFRCRSSTVSALLLRTRSYSVCREPEWHVSTGLHRAASHLLWTGGKRSRNVRKEDATVSTRGPLGRLLSRQPLPCSTKVESGC